MTDTDKMMDGAEIPPEFDLNVNDGDPLPDPPEDAPIEEPFPTSNDTPIIS